MADEVSDAEGARHQPLDMEKVQKIFEINDILDQMVAQVVGLLVGAIQTLPSYPGKIAFVNKLKRALETIEEELRKEQRGDSKRVRRMG